MVPPPPGVAAQDSAAKFAEGRARFFLWVWPQFLGWSKPFVWLFSPVNGNLPPGDLYGVDSAGDLIIAEGKTWASGQPQDAFKNFIRNGEPYPSFIDRGGSVKELLTDWDRLLAQERQFIAEFRDVLASGQVLPKATYPGVVPYSTSRKSVQNWRELYLTTLAPMLSEQVYEQSVRDYLRIRTERGSPVPHFVGLYASRLDRELISVRSTNSHQTLLNRIGRQNVHQMVMRCRVADGGLEVTSHRCESLDERASNLGVRRLATPSSQKTGVAAALHERHHRADYRRPMSVSALRICFGAGRCVLSLQNAAAT